MTSLKYRCAARVASRPTWEGRPCLLPATVQTKDGCWWCHVHAPKGASKRQGRGRSGKGIHSSPQPPRRDPGANQGDSKGFEPAEIEALRDLRKASKQQWVEFDLFLRRIVFALERGWVTGLRIDRDPKDGKVQLSYRTTRLGEEALHRFDSLDAANNT